MNVSPVPIQPPYFLRKRFVNDLDQGLGNTRERWLSQRLETQKALKRKQRSRQR